MKHEVARKSIFAKVCYFSLSLSFSPSLPLLESRQCQAERLTDWLTEAGRASSGNPRTYRVGSFLRRVACTARSMEFLLSGLHPRVVAPSPPSLLRQLRRVLVYPCSTPLVQPPSLLLSPRGIQGVETEADISLSVSCFRSHSEIRPLIRRARRNMHMLALGLVVHQGYSSPWGHSNCFSFFLFF